MLRSKVLKYQKNVSQGFNGTYLKRHDDLRGGGDGRRCDVLHRRDNRGGDGANRLDLRNRTTYDMLYVSYLLWPVGTLVLITDRSRNDSRRFLNAISYNRHQERTERTPIMNCIVVKKYIYYVIGMYIKRPTQAVHISLRCSLSWVSMFMQPRCTKLNVLIDQVT